MRILAVLVFLFISSPWNSSPALASGRLSVSPTSIWFFDTHVNGPMQRATVSVYNRGDETIKNLWVRDTCGINFWIYDSCYSDLEPGRSCTITVHLDPRMAGWEYCNVDVSGSGANSAWVSVRARIEDNSFNGTEERR